MSSHSQKNKVSLPSLESQLNDGEKSRLDAAIEEAGVLSGANFLPAPTSVPTAVSNQEALVSQPVLPEHMPGFASGPTAAMADALQSLPRSGPLEAMTYQQLKSQVDATATAVLAAPIVTAAATFMYEGRKHMIPESVRDVPNKLCTTNPQEAAKRYGLFLSGLTEKQHNELTDLAARCGGLKPLMWLSEKLYFLLAVVRWMPPKNNSSESFDPADQKPGSQGYEILMSTFGIDCGNQVLVAAERCNVGILPLIAQAAHRMLEMHHEEIARNATTSTVQPWKR